MNGWLLRISNQAYNKQHNLGYVIVYKIVEGRSWREIVLHKIASEEVNHRIQNEVDGLRKEFHSCKSSRDIAQRTHWYSSQIQEMREN